MATKQREEGVIALIMNFIVSGYVYFVAFMLVLYMVSTLVTSVLSIGFEMYDLASSSSGLFATPERTALELGLLHTIAFTIVLVKAYKILIAYAETRHINLKFLMEIAIIAPVIELIFNSNAYSFQVMALLAGFAVIVLITYLFFYKTVTKVSDDYEKACLR